MRLISRKTFVLIAAAALASTMGTATLVAQNPQGQPFQAIQAAVSALQAQVRDLTAAVTALQSQGAATQAEIWRLGSPSANTHTGQLVPGNYFFGSGPFLGDPTSVINAFDTISPDAKRVRRVTAMVGNRAGSYGHGLYLAIEARGYDGSLHRVLSTAQVNLETVNQLEWIDVPITSSQDAIVLPGEYLASHVTLGGAPDGNLTLILGARAEVVDPQ